MFTRATGGDRDGAAFLGRTSRPPTSRGRSHDLRLFGSAADADHPRRRGYGSLGHPVPGDGEKLADLKVPVETLTIPDVGHGFVGNTPKITRAANDQALVRTVEFVDQLFGC